MLTVKMHRCGKDLLLAAADKELLGQTLRDKDLKLEVSPEFYDGEDASEEVLLNRLSMCTMANLVGQETVGVAIRENYINSECVLSIAGVPHAQMVKC
jgi:uncharacterized protein